MEFSYYNPTRVSFGPLDAQALGSELDRFGKHVLVLTGCSHSAAVANELASALSEGRSVIVCPGVRSNPPEELIGSMAERENLPDVILTVGGGSVHDAGKALSLSLTNGGPLSQYAVDGKLGAGGIANEPIPVVAVPTLFGTGAEISPAALIRFGNEKKVVFSTSFYPTTAFVDPTNALGADERLVIDAALDAFVQGVESYVSTQASSFSRMFSKAAVENSMSGMLSIVRGENRLEALAAIALGALQSLYAVGQSTVGAAHALSDPLSGRFDMHHGKAVGALLPFVVEANYGAAPGPYDKLGTIIGDALGAPSEPVSDQVARFYDMIGFSPAEAMRDVDREAFARDEADIVAESMNGDMAGNPLEFTESTVRSVFEKAIVS